MVLITVLLPSGRILQHLAAMGVIEEVDTDIYAPTDLSNALIEPKHRDPFPSVSANEREILISVL